MYEYVGNIRKQRWDKMGKEEMSLNRKVINVILNIALIVGVIITFYKLPSILADKISYWKLQKTEIKQEFDEEE